ncbi:unnamed protein product, partial [Musa acuminata subsp. burmannicoides]
LEAHHGSQQGQQRDLDAAPLPSGSIVLTQPLNGSFLERARPLHPGFAAAQRNPRGELLQERQAPRHHLLGLPPRAVEDDEDGGRAGHLGGEGAEVPAPGKEEDGRGGISAVAVVEGVEKGVGTKAEAAAGEGVVGGEKGEGGEGVAAKCMGVMEHDDGGGGVKRLRREVRAHPHARRAAAPIPAHLPLPLPFLQHRLFLFLRINAGTHRRS